MEKYNPVTISELADWCVLSERRLQQLVKEKPGIIKKAGRGCYLLRESVRSYINYICGANIGKKKSDYVGAKRIPTDDPRARLAEAKARIAEAEAARLEGEQIRVDIAVALFADMVANARTKLLTLESRVPIEARNITRDIVHDALNELSQYNQSELISRLCGQSTIDVDAAAEPESQ